MQHRQDVNVTLRDFSIEPGEIRVKSHERVRFVIRNEGKMDHEFKVQGEHEQVEVEHVPPGRAKTLEHTFHHAGVFETACGYPDHAEQGMRGVLVVE